MDTGGELNVATQVWVLINAQTSILVEYLTSVGRQEDCWLTLQHQRLASRLVNKRERIAVTVKPLLLRHSDKA